MIRKTILLVCVTLILITMVTGAMSYSGSGIRLSYKELPKPKAYEAMERQIVDPKKDDAQASKATSRPEVLEIGIGRNVPIGGAYSIMDATILKGCMVLEHRCGIPMKYTSLIVVDRKDYLICRVLKAPAPRSTTPVFCERTRIEIPLWSPLILFSLYPAVAFIRGPCRRHRRRRKKGLCLECGYDLTGNVSGICPECGKRIRSG